MGLLEHVSLYKNTHGSHQQDAREENAVSSGLRQCINVHPPCSPNHHVKQHHYSLTDLTEQCWGAPHPPRHAAGIQEALPSPARGTGSPALLPGGMTCLAAAQRFLHAIQDHEVSELWSGAGPAGCLLPGSRVRALHLCGGCVTPAPLGHAFGSPAPGASGSRSGWSSGAPPA